MAEKTLKPTAKKLRDARLKGQVAKSKEVIATAVLCALVLVGGAAGRQLIDLASGLVALGFDFESVQREPLQLLQVMEHAGMFLVLALLAVAALQLFAAVLAGFLQTRGLVLSFDPIVPKFERLNPAENAKKLFSLKQVFEISRKLVVIAVFTAVLTQLYKMLLAPSLLMVYAPETVFDNLARGLVLLFGSCTMIVIVAAAIDYGLQLYEFGKDQRMSIDDVRREHRDMEGDPYVKAQRRAQRRELAQARPRQAKRRPSVVVTNPTHVAVALFYEPGGDPPCVVAKGLDADAFKIRRDAQARHIPVLEDPPLARKLYRAVAVDDIIENELFDAVAQVLVWAQQVQQSAGRAPRARPADKAPTDAPVRTSGEAAETPASPSSSPRA